MGLPEAERAVTEGAHGPAATSVAPAVVPPVFVIHFGKRINLHLGQAIPTKIYFTTWKSNLQTGGKFFLRALLQVLSNFDMMQIEINGFTPGPYVGKSKEVQEARVRPPDALRVAKQQGTALACGRPGCLCDALAFCLCLFWHAECTAPGFDILNRGQTSTLAHRPHCCCVRGNDLSLGTGRPMLCVSSC